MRTATIERKTKETDIALTLCLDGGEVSVNTGVGFFDHMLTAFATHAGFGLQVTCKGDLEVDCHHTVEDVGIVLGKALFDFGHDLTIGHFLLPRFGPIISTEAILNKKRTLFGVLALENVGVFVIDLA